MKIISLLNFYVYRAQSGTGKTATFSISILQCLDTQVRETQALVLSPTRELAGQIQKVRNWNLIVNMWVTSEEVRTSQDFESVE